MKNEVWLVNNQMIHNMLVAKFQSNRILGNITFNTADGNIGIKERDIIGNAIQSWLASWFNSNLITYSKPLNTQSFPDYMINSNMGKQENLEVKCWYGPASPGFDIANFESYVDTLLQDPTKIDTDYLIFKYNIDEDGNISIEDVFLKKIWEITCASGPYPLKVQAKRGQIYNIRPASWYSKNVKYKPFATRNDFVQALSQTLVAYKGKSKYTSSWYSTVATKYKQMTNNQL